MRECSERQVRRTRPKVIASCRARECKSEAVGRGFLPREKVIERGITFTARDNFQSRSLSAKCCEFYPSLHDRFHLEVRIPFYPMRTWKLAAWVTLIIAGMRWWAGRRREYRWREARSLGRSPGRVQGRSPGGRFGGLRPRLSRTDLKMFHEKILSRNEAWLVKIRKQITTEKK